MPAVNHRKMYEDTEQMSDGHRRSLSLPSHLGRQSSGQKRRDGPSIWDLQEALRREGHLDAESECTSEPGSEPSSAASTPHGSLGASSGAAFAEQFEQAYGGGSWPRVRKQRTSERSASAMSLWEVSEALGVVRLDLERCLDVSPGAGFVASAQPDQTEEVVRGGVRPIRSDLRAEDAFGLCDLALCEVLPSLLDRATQWSSPAPTPPARSARGRTAVS